MTRGFAALVLASFLSGCGAKREGADGPPISVAALDVAADSTVLWARAPASGVLTFEIDGRRLERVAASGSDQTVTWAVAGLAPETSYSYRVHQGGSAGEGVFVTAPEPATRASVRFVWGGDVAGQNICRDAAIGMPVFNAMTALRPHFFLGLGDMIYADNPCESVGALGNAQLPDLAAPAESLADFHAKWRYVREAPALQALLAQAGHYSVWDDHEVINDFDPTTAGPLLPPARAAYIDYNRARVPERAAQPLYLERRWGRHVHLFLLDTRTDRDDNAAPDTATKTMLGAAQRRWLTAGLIASDATWKIIVSSVPIAIPTGWPPEGARDGWASGDGPTGFEAELEGLLRTLAESDVRNVVFLTTDVHHATGFRYQPFGEHRDFEFHEFVTGPLHAGVFPNLALDATFNPTRLFLHSPRRAADVDTIDTALGWFNFGFTEVDANGRLDMRVVDARGLTVARVVLAPR